ncbi:MAG: hypothetical protein MUC60_13740 [Oscillatoria sp. Prado101]|nr:hypothetical protein [Oscillatoria sp. Prado101]
MRPKSASWRSRLVPDAPAVPVLGCRCWGAGAGVPVLEVQKYANALKPARFSGLSQRHLMWCGVGYAGAFPTLQIEGLAWEVAAGGHVEGVGCAGAFPTLQIEGLPKS